MMKIQSAILTDNGWSVDTGTSQVPIQIFTCWLTNSNYPTTEQNGARFSGTTSGCIFGPCLSHAIVKADNPQTLNMMTCTLIDPTIDAIRARNSNTSNNVLKVLQTTCFLTPLNPSGVSHSCVSAVGDAAQLLFNSNIFWGGAVKVPAGVHETDPNYEWMVTGNTTFLAYEQGNPQMLANLGSYPNNVSWSTLVNTDWRSSNTNFGSGYNVSTLVQNIGFSY